MYVYMWESPFEIADYRISPLLENGVSKSTTFKEWKVALYNVDTDLKSFQRNSAWLPPYLKHRLHLLMLKAHLASVHSPLASLNLQQWNQLFELTDMLFRDILLNSHSSIIGTCSKGRSNGYLYWDVRQAAIFPILCVYIKWWVMCIWQTISPRKKLESTWNLMNVYRRPAST